MYIILKVMFNMCKVSFFLFNEEKIVSATLRGDARICRTAETPATVWLVQVKNCFVVAG